MKRDEAEKLIVKYDDAQGALAVAVQHPKTSRYSVDEANRMIKDAHDRLLAALTGSNRPEVDLRKEIMNIQVDEEKIHAALAECGDHILANRAGLSAIEAYKLGHRDARHAAAEIVTGTWRKVEP